MDWLAWIYRKLALPRLNSNNTIFHQFCFLVHLDVVNITKKFCKYNQIRALTALDLSTKQFFAVLVSRHPTPTDDDWTKLMLTFPWNTFLNSMIKLPRTYASLFIIGRSRFCGQWIWKLYLCLMRDQDCSVMLNWLERDKIFRICWISILRN